MGLQDLLSRLLRYTYRHLAFNWRRSSLPMGTIATGTLLVYMVLTLTGVVKAQLAQLQGTLSAATVRDAEKAIIYIAVIALAVGALETAIIMTRSVLSRIHEVGLLKATGIPDQIIFSLFLIEAILYGLGGGFIGAILGWLVAGLIQVLNGSTLAIAWIPDGGNLVLSIGLAVFVSLVAAFLPIWRIVRLSAIKAIYYQF